LEVHIAVLSLHVIFIQFRFPGYNKSEKVSSKGLIVLPISLCKELQSFVDVVLAQSLMEKRRNSSFISMQTHFPWAIQTRRFGEKTK